MKQLTIRQMREKLGSLDQIIKSEGEIVVTRRGVPIARLLPVNASSEKPSHNDLRNKMKKLTTPSQIMISRERDER